MGNPIVCVVSLRGAPLTLPTFATPGFERFFGLGRAVRCLIPLGDRRFMHLVVLYGYHGADSSAERLQLTNQLFEAALSELCVVARVQPCLIVGDFNVEPTKIPCLAKGISARLWVGLEASWAVAPGRNNNNSSSSINSNNNAGFRQVARRTTPSSVVFWGETPVGSRMVQERGGAGAGRAAIPGAALRFERPCDHTATSSSSSSSMTCPRSSSSTEWWTFLLFGRDVFPQCSLCRKPSKFSRCRSRGWS